MNSFCEQAKRNLNGNAAGSSEKEKAGCGCGSQSLQYEPLTKEWFKDNAGIIALVVTLIMIIARNS